MKNYEQIKEFLKKDMNFFDAESMRNTKDLISDLIYSNDRGIFILSGEAGIGKSRVINSIVDEVKEDVFILNSPPTLERNFLEEVYLQLRKKRFSKDVKIDEIRIRVNDAFKKINHTIIIDNIGESYTPLIEDIGKSLNSSMKDLKIILVLDKVFKDLLEIKSSCKFKVQDSINVKPISKTDLEIFFQQSFEKFNIQKEVNTILNNFDFIYTITDGNILKFNKFIETVFDILATAEKENIGKFKKLNKCVLVMSALDNELVDG